MTEVNTFVHSAFIKDSIVEIDLQKTYSDDDSTCSFDSEDNLLTPPEEEEEDDDDDWEFWSQVISKEPINKRWLSIHAQHGIPSALRGTIWRILANFTCHEDQYIQLLKQESMDERAILRDLHRTFPHHPFFQSAIGQEALLNIVKAYSILDPEVGYCQGLLFISGPLLLHMPEEEAFYTLVQLMQQYDLRGHYTPQLDLLRQRLYQWDGLLQTHLPRLDRHFKSQDVRSNMYASHWFLTLFAYKFPLNFVFRIYDMLLVDGVRCLFCIGIALLSKNQDTLLSLEFESLVHYLKDDDLLHAFDDVSELMEAASLVKVSTRELDKLANEFHMESFGAKKKSMVVESLRKEKRVLKENYKKCKGEYEQVRKEHALVAQQLVVNQRAVNVVRQENQVHEQHIDRLKMALTVIPDQIEQQVQSDIKILVSKNQDLQQRTSQLQAQLGSIQGLVIDIRKKYNASVEERNTLNEKLNELKNCMSIPIS